MYIRKTKTKNLDEGRAFDEETKETRLYCHSEQKAKKSKASATAFLCGWKKHSVSLMRGEQKIHKNTGKYRSTARKKPS